MNSKWFNIFVFSIVSIVSVQGFVCYEGICNELKTEPPTCEGSVIKNGGICGCSDVCARQLGQQCGIPGAPIRGRLPQPPCDTGLTCKPTEMMILGIGRCIKSHQQTEVNITARQTERTLCQQRRIQAMIVQIVYQGQWFPKCDEVGLFLPQQCDNTGTCFCVDVETGVVDETSKVEGEAKCGKKETAITNPTTSAPSTQAQTTQQPSSTSWIPEWGF